MNSNESAKVRLRTLVERNALREERAAPLEVQGLLSSAKDYLADARRQTNSQATRFNVAYEAAHAIALAAMRALDLRPAQGPGHRAVVFNALNSTTGATAAVFAIINRYDGLTTFSAAELAELIDCATALERIVRAEITKHRPELLVPPEASP